jgi:hypothetical protein
MHLKVETPCHDRLPITTLQTYSSLKGILRRLCRLNGKDCSLSDALDLLNEVECMVKKDPAKSNGGDMASFRETISDCLLYEMHNLFALVQSELNLLEEEKVHNNEPLSPSTADTDTLRETIRGEKRSEANYKAAAEPSDEYEHHEGKDGDSSLSPELAEILDEVYGE